jgi:hypothetical protein
MIIGKASGIFLGNCNTPSIDNSQDVQRTS